MSAKNGQRNNGQGERIRVRTTDLGVLLSYKHVQMVFAMDRGAQFDRRKLASELDKLPRVHAWLGNAISAPKQDRLIGSDFGRAGFKLNVYALPAGAEPLTEVEFQKAFDRFKQEVLRVGTTK